MFQILLFGSHKINVDFFQPFRLLRHIFSTQINQVSHRIESIKNVKFARFLLLRKRQYQFNKKVWNLFFSSNNGEEQVRRSAKPEILWTGRNS